MNVRSAVALPCEFKTLDEPSLSTDHSRFS